MRPLVHLEASRLRIGRREFFSALSLDWRPGEHWGVVGPNSSGKTTLLRLLSGDLAAPGVAVDYGFPGRGGGDPAARVAVVSLERQAEELAAFGMYAQMRWNSTEEESTPAVDDWLSFESVEGIGPYELRTVTKAEREAFARRRAPLLRALRLEHLLRRRLAELSNGETRRAFLAKALLSRPRLLLLDEPFAGLDDESRRLFAALLERLARGRAVSILVASLFEDELPPFLNRRLRLGNCQPPAPRSPSPSKAKGRPRPGRPLVEMRGVRIAYGDNVVFDGFDWTVRAGERWLLTGPNGSGKSTLIALMTGDHLQSYANDLRLFGRRRGTGESIWDIKRRIGWVSPELHLEMDPAQTVMETVLSGFNDTPLYVPTDTPAKRRAAESLLRRMGLFGRRVDPFGNLASGEQRFVLLARAFVKRPPLLVLDEPCQTLDAAHRARFHALLDRLCEETGAALVYTTHLPDDVPGCITHRLSTRH